MINTNKKGHKQEMAVPRSNWKKGDERHYKVYKSKIRTKDELEIQRETKIQYLEVEVVKANENFYELEWSEFNETTNRFKRIVENILGFRLTHTFNIRYKTNLNGSIEELLRTEELEEQLEIVKALINEEDSMGLDSDKIISEDLILTKLLTKVNIFHLPYEIEFTEHGEVTEQKFDNHLMSGNDLPGELSYSLIYYNEESQIGEVEMEKRYYHTILNEKLSETITDIDEKLGKEEREEKLPPFSVSERFWYKIDFKTGWILNGRYEKGFLTEDQDTIDEIVFEKIK